MTSRFGRISGITDPCNPDIDVAVTRGTGLNLTVNGHPVEDTYGALLMAEIAVLRSFPAVRVDVDYRCRQCPAPAFMARLIAAELDRNEIWD